MKRKLDRTRGAAPLYHQLEAILRERIESGEFSPGSVFPCEREIMEEYGVSRITVRQAMRNLSDSRYISSHPGRGTVVVFSKINEVLGSVISFSEEMARHGITMSTSFCRAEYIVPDRQVSIELGLGEGERCFSLTRVRDAGGVPLVYSETYMPQSWQLEADPGLYMESLYGYLRSERGITVERAVDTLEAAAASPAVASVLGIGEGVPVFKRTRRSFACNGRILEYTVCYYPADRYKYTVEL